MKNAYFLLCVLAAACAAQAAITVTPHARPDGQLERVEVETQLYRIDFSLAEGGSATSMIYKPLNHQLRAEDYYRFRNNLFREWLRLAEPDAETGLTPEREKVSRIDFPATHRIVRQSDEELVIEFERKVQAPAEAPEWFSHFTLRRRVHLRDAHPAVRVEAEVVNGDAADHEVILEIYNGLSLDRVESLVSLPGIEGPIRGIDKAAERGSRTLYAPELAGAWMGAVNANRLGAAFSFDWADVDGLAADMWKTVGSGYRACMRRLNVPAGKSVTFAYTFMPFTGLEALDGMAGDLAGGVAVGNAKFPADVAADEIKPGATVPLRVGLVSGTDRAVRVAVQARRQEDEALVLDEKHELTLAAGQAASLASACPLATDGLYVITITADGGDGAVLRMDKALEVGKTKLTFAPTPPAGPKRGVRDAGETLGPRPMDAQFRTIDRSFVTPHLPLMKNDAGGTLQVFFLTPADHTLGHVRELSQRVDLSYDYFAAGKIDAPPGDLNFRDVTAFRKALRAADPPVLVTLAIDWDAGLKRELSRELLDRVRDGMGLVLADRDLKKQPELQRALAEAVEITDVPLPASAVPMPTVRRFELGKGRVAVIVCGWHPLRDGGEAALGQWTSLQLGDHRLAIADIEWRGFEYSYAFLGQLIRWAGRLDPAVTIIGAALKGSAVAVEMNHRGQSAAGTLEVVARGPRWQELGRAGREVELPAGPSTQTIELPPLPGGPMALEITLRNREGKLIAFGSAGVKAPETVTIRITPSDEYQRVDKLGTVDIEVAGELPDGQLHARVVDRFGRLVLEHREALKPQEGPVKVNLNLQSIRPVTIYHEVIAEVTSSGDEPRLLARAAQPLYLLPTRPDYADRFVIAVADSPDRTARHVQGAVPTARALGMTLHTHARDDAMLYSTGGLKAGSAKLSPMKDGRYSVDRKAKQSLDGTKLAMRPPLLPDEEAFNATRERWMREARKAYETGAFQVMIDDERRMSGDFDQSEQTMAGFRKWIAERYESIEQLNAAWGAQFESFEQVVPKRREDVADSDNKAPWLEFRMYIGHVLGEYYMKQPAEWAAQISPDLSVGEMGIYDLAYTWPVDWSRYARYYKHTQRYGDVQGSIEAVFRSFSPETNHGVWTGYGMRKISSIARLTPWRSLLCGGHSVWYWALEDYGFFNYAVCTADWRATAGYAVLAKEEWPDIQGGIDRLIIASDAVHDGIAVAYSYPSWLIDNTSLAVTGKRIVEQLGFQDRYVNLADMPTALGEHRLLILQEVGCISDEQAAAISQFVENGGVVLMIGRNGWRDLRGVPHAKGSVIDSLAGVDLSAVKPADRMADVKLGDDTMRLQVKWDQVATAGVELLATTRIDGRTVPVLTRRSTGKGRAYWLNSTLAGHDVQRANDDVDPATDDRPAVASVAESHWRIFDQVIADAGIRPRARVMLGTHPVFDGETFYHQSPSRRTMFVSRALGRLNDQTLTVALDKPAHVYDMRGGRYLGRGDRFEETFPAGRMQVYALLDYRVAQLEAEADAGAVKQGGVARIRCRIKTDGPPADLHAFRYAVLDPSGEAVPGLRGAVLAPQGAAELELPMALNQAPGHYTAEITDAISHAKAKVTVEVQPR